MDTDKIAAGPELDALVAEKVMGGAKTCRKPMILRPFGGHPEWGKCLECGAISEYASHGGYCQGTCEFEVAPYSTSIAFAWEVVQKVGRDWLISPEGQVIGCSYGDTWLISDGDGSAPLAIARAALKAAL